MSIKKSGLNTLQILKDADFRKKIFSSGQKYLINTLFDTINSILGVVIGLYLAEEAKAYVFIMSIISTAIALGISSGTSIYEAEYFEQIREIKEIEKHMITNFEENNPVITKKAKLTGIFVGIMNFLTPLIIAMILILFFIMLPELSWAFWSTISVSGAILFVSGLYFGKLNNLPPLKRGLRMFIIGMVTFLAVYSVGILF